MPEILDRCVKKVMATGTSQSRAFAICTAQLQKAGKLPTKESKSRVLKNVKLSWKANFQILESGENKEGKWLSLGGVALEEGISRNNNKYTFENLAENHGKSFKWIFGHPAEIEEHILGLGTLKHSGHTLFHEGKIRNTSTHPDVVESVKDGFLGPSIHASAKKITEEDGQYKMEGLEIDGVSLVAFQGVESASIDYAIAESFDKMESSNEDGIKITGEVKKMSEEEIKSVETEKVAAEVVADETKKTKVKEVSEAKHISGVDKCVADAMAKGMSKADASAKCQPKATESLNAEEIKFLKEELTALKNAKKNDLVKSIIETNGDFKKEELMKETEDRLQLILEYEKKLATRTESTAVVEINEATDDNAFVEGKDGSLSLTEEMYKKFNREIRERVR